MIHFDQKAVFISRPNRFQLWVKFISGELGGKEELVYMANPGRLVEILHPGTVIWLEKAKNPKSKMPWAATAVETAWGVISLNTHLANDVAEYLLRRHLVAGLGDWDVVRREIKMGNSRFDFLLGRKDKKGNEELLYLEVKSCSLYSARTTQFPDAVTARGKKHIDELVHLSEKGVPTAVLLLSQNPSSEFFLPDWHTDIEFAQSFMAARGKVGLYPVAQAFSPIDGSLLGEPKPLTIPWAVIEEHAKDEGCYLMVYELDADKKISIGALGELEFKAGFYLYVGSAKKNLQKRMARHRKKRKKLHWHLDYFSAHAASAQAFAIAAQGDLECRLAAAFKKLAVKEIPKFGSSDCKCESHFFYFQSNPTHNPDFHKNLQFFRIEELL
ncbi:MAG: DNA/RNA nuclease SfsA [SAR324 cluster bacterium]|nr:DNA/RNA nuclease SfsA [SAR324 cluster bacterium]